MTNENGSLHAEIGSELVKTQLPSLTELAKKDSDLREMIQLICDYNLRSQAVYLIGRKMLQKPIKKPVFAR